MSLTPSRRTFAKTTAAATIGTGLMTTRTVHASSDELTDEELIDKILNRNDIEYIEPKPDEGFHHGFIIKRPIKLPLTEQTEAPPITVSMAFTGQDSTLDGEREYTMTETKRIAASHATWGGYLRAGRRLQTLHIQPVIQPPSYEEVSVYPPALDKGTLQMDREEYERIDQQILAMVDHARQKVNGNRDEKLVTEEGIIALGYSVHAKFANRFALIHPDEVVAVIAGGTFIHTIPTNEWNGHDMPYPLGTGGLSELVNKEINIQSYKKIPKFMFGNDGDTPVSIRADNYYSGLSDTASDIYPMDQDEPAKRLKKTREIFTDLNCNISTKIYHKQGHNLKTPNVYNDIEKFLYKKDVTSKPENRTQKQNENKNKTQNNNRTNHANNTKKQEEHDTPNNESDESAGIWVITSLIGVILAVIMKSRSDGQSNNE